MQWVVDVYHVMLYLFAAASALGTEAAQQWVGQRVIELIEMGGPKFIELLKATGPPEASPATFCHGTSSAGHPPGARLLPLARLILLLLNALLRLFEKTQTFGGA